MSSSRIGKEEEGEARLPATRDMFRENLTRELPDNDDRDDRGQTEDETQKDSQEREMKFARSRRSEEGFAWLVSRHSLQTGA